jgi:hypothetical protein
MGRSERTSLYSEIEAHRGHPLISYVTSKRDGAHAIMATDALPFLIEQLDLLPPNTRELDLLIVSYGGDPMVAWRIMSLIRQRVDKVYVLVPQSAYSAATMVALGADEIVMHPNSHLGPVDMQIMMPGSTGRQFSTEEIAAFLDFVRDQLGITDQEHLRGLFELTCKEVGSLGVGFIARSARLAVDLGERLLGMHLKKVDAPKRRAIVEELSRVFQAHDYPVSRDEAIAINLQVNKKQDKKLEDSMWNLWLDIEADLKERSPYRTLKELMNSSEAAKLLAPVPQLSLPANAPAPSMFSADLAQVTAAASISVNPIDVEVLEAVIESARRFCSRVTRQKIIACRTPDLVVQFNELPAFSGWECAHP